MEQRKSHQTLFRAAEKGDVEAVRELLRNGAIVDGRLGHDGVGYDHECDISWISRPRMYEWSPLMVAVNHGFIDIVEVLLDNGARIEAAGSDGMTALSHAVRTGQVSVARLLISQGANVHVRRSIGGDTLLHLAAYTGYNEVIELLIAQRVEVNATNDYGSTALHIAASLGLLDTASLLVQFGVNVQAKDQYGDTSSAPTGSRSPCRGLHWKAFYRDCA